MPRRMAFVYEFEADEFGVVPDIPTTVRRSKADCPQVCHLIALGAVRDQLPGGVNASCGDVRTPHRL
jgi:hypothetical protein